jgi:phage FluMu protein Com
VLEECGKIYAYEVLVCPKCKYRNEAKRERFGRFKKQCKHKETYTIYRYIPGECVMEPDYEQCMICGQTV